MRRVVVTGMGAVSPFGHGVKPLLAGLENNESGITYLEELEGIDGILPTLGGKVPAGRAAYSDIERKFRRTMSPMSLFATVAAREAIAQARLSPRMLENGQTGLCVSSTTGSVQALEAFFSVFLKNNSVAGIKAVEFFKIMNHSCAANLTNYFQIRGRVMAPSAACSTGCQAIGLAAEAIALGRQDAMLCGGADELHPLTVGTFTLMQAASTGYNDRPTCSPRPFDRDRDGLVCSEGAGIVVLEALESARQRKVPILAEIAGFSSTADPVNMATPRPEALMDCMECALADAGMEKDAVDYVNAHATGTELGDAAECAAIGKLFGKKPLVSSLKGHLGHTMAASGTLELIASIAMLRHGFVLPTRNLETIADSCSAVTHVQDRCTRPLSVVLKNNFALGGINSSLILRRDT